MKDLKVETKKLTKTSLQMQIIVLAVVIVCVLVSYLMYSRIKEGEQEKADILAENSRLVSELAKERQANTILRARLSKAGRDSLVFKSRLNRLNNSNSLLQERARLLETKLNVLFFEQSVKNKSVVKKESFKNRLEKIIERFKRLERRNKEILEESRAKQKNIKLEQKRKFYVGLWHDYYQKRSFKPVGFQLADSALKDLFESNPQLLNLSKYDYGEKLADHFKFFYKIDFYHYYSITEYYFLNLLQSVQSSVPRKADKDYAVLLGIALNNQWLVDGLEVKLKEVTSIAGKSIEGGSLYEICKDIDYLKKNARSVPKDVLIGDVLIGKK